LRVGKTAPKANTHTNTSFVAKTIHLPSQSIVSALGAGDHDAFHKHLSLCKHHASSTRKEALVYIQSHVPHFHAANMKAVVNAVAPLILDDSSTVREALLELLRSLPPQTVEPHSSLIMLYVHSAMTHLTPEIRADSTRFLDYLVDVAPTEVARLSFVKTLNCFFPLFGWPLDESSATALNTRVTLAASTVTTGLSFGAKASKAKTTHLQSLEKLLAMALDGSWNDNNSNVSSFHPDTNKFLLTSTPTPYLSLELFSSKASQVTVTEDLNDRVSAIKSKYLVPLKRGLDESLKQGGQPGRIAKNILSTLNSLD
jgi:pre-rRNA-processing protein IPI1